MKFANIFYEILLIDNTPDSFFFFCDLHPNIQVVFLPPNTTSLIQPKDKGVIAALKASYLRGPFGQGIATPEQDTEKTPVQVWMDYSIKNLAEAWGDVTK